MRRSIIAIHMTASIMRPTWPVMGIDIPVVVPVIPRAKARAPLSPICTAIRAVYSHATHATAIRPVSAIALSGRSLMSRSLAVAHAE